jgi:anti-sigma regulatory factor (Ser/Thr protein kinase)
MDSTDAIGMLTAGEIGIPVPPWVSRAVPVAKPGQADEVHRIATELAGSLGFDQTQLENLAEVVTEAARTLREHATQGEMLLRPLGTEGPAPGTFMPAGIEILVLDHGPGMTNAAERFHDRLSAVLPCDTSPAAIDAPTAFLDTFSLPGVVGTVLVVRIWSSPPPYATRPHATHPTGEDLHLGAICLPPRGQDACGDAWAIASLASRHRILVVDGLGNGVPAAEAAAQALHAFRENAERALAEILRAAHETLRETRGAAVAIAEIDCARRTVRFVGVGNIAARVISSSGNLNLVSHSGTVGRLVLKAQEFAGEYAPGAMLVVHSDGLGSHWRLERYAGLAARHPAVIAGVLYRDFARKSDDVTVLVARAAEAPGGEP